MNLIYFNATSKIDPVNALRRRCFLLTQLPAPSASHTASLNQQDFTF